MPSIENSVMELYLATSIEELNSMGELPEKFKKTNIKSLIATANKLYSNGEENFLKGDQERSYLYFVKYLNIISIIKKSPEYRKDKIYIHEIVGKKKVQTAVERAEYLNGRLRERYIEKLEEIEVKKRLEELDRKETEKRETSGKAPEESEKQQESKLVNDIVPRQDVISSWDLNSMIKQKSTSFIMFDVRSKDDFEQSHIAHPNCVNIPKDIIKQGLSAAVLYESLPEKTKKEWPKRLTADVIILIDWFGKRETGNAVNTLEVIFTKWDPNSKYNGSVKLLEGGYDDWLSRFPTETTNPHASKPVVQTVSHSLVTVDDIDYPDMDESFGLLEHNKVLTVQAPQIERNKKPRSGKETVYFKDSLSIESAVKETEKETNTVSQKNKIPLVDRQLKKSALTKYEGFDNSHREYLKEREDLVESSIITATQNLEREMEWEEICREKEVTIDGLIKIELQKREEELLQQLKEMERVRLEQDQQIAKLKEKVDEFHRPDEIQTTEEQDIERSIRSREEEKSRLDQLVEDMRKLRKKKEEEEAKKKEEEEAKKKADEIRRAEDERKKDEAAKKQAAELRKKQELEEKKKQESSIIKNVTKAKLKDNTTSTNLGTKLNRSHSTPDLAQALQNDLKENTKPFVERSLKPSITNRTNFVGKLDTNKNRNFAPIYGNMGRALTGLKNLGNTCYMNSIIQCINNTTALTKFFIEGNYRGFLNKSNKVTKGEIAEEIAAVVKALWSGQYRCIACKDLKAVTGRYKSSFRGYEQQDSHEFLTILLDWLHEDLNEVKVKAPLKEQNNDNIPDSKAAQMAWEDYNNSNKSIIVQLFGGQQRSSLRCLYCGKESVTFEPFFNLSLPIPQSTSHCDIMDCFRLYTKPERVSGWSCPSCKKRQDANKKIDIWRLPTILIVHLQRFYNDGIWRKRLTMVDFNINDLDLRTITVGDQKRNVQFKLYAVSNHYGTMDGGHYTAYCKNRIYDRWFKFDDQDVMELTPNEVRSAAAYILFYTTVEYDVPQVTEE